MRRLWDERGWELARAEVADAVLEIDVLAPPSGVPDYAIARKRR